MTKPSCLLVLALLAGGHPNTCVLSFAPPPQSLPIISGITQRSSVSSLSCLGAIIKRRIDGGDVDYDNNRNNNNNNNISGNSDVNSKQVVNTRRKALQTIVSSALFVATASASSSSAEAASSNSELFKPNPLTNPILEQMRIRNQDEADNIKYGGELASASSKPSEFDQYVQLLQPILSVENDIVAIDSLLQQQNSNNKTTRKEYLTAFHAILQILSKPLFVKLNFKKAFNAFADNIYYSDPDQANLYLGGGAIPKPTQSIAYLLRNDLLTNLEDMNAEVAYLVKVLEKEKSDDDVVVVGGEGGLDLEDLFGFVKDAKEGMVKYLDLVPPRELEAARLKFNSN